GALEGRKAPGFLCSAGGFFFWLGSATAKRGLRNDAPTILQGTVHPLNVFDVSSEIIQQAWLPGRVNLLFDATFLVYKRAGPGCRDSRSATRKTGAEQGD